MNKITKRVIAFFLVMAMALTTFACGNADEDTNKQNNESNAEDHKDANNKQDAPADSPVVMDKNITVNEDGSVTITNPDGGTDVFVGYELAVKAGQQVSFDVEISHNQDVAIWLFCNGIVSTDKEYYANWHTFAANGKYTVTIDGSNIRTDMECFQLRFRYTYNTPKDCVITVSNLQITNP